MLQSLGRTLDAAVLAKSLYDKPYCFVTSEPVIGIITLACIFIVLLLLSIYLIVLC